jgi:hypothetical protein
MTFVDFLQKWALFRPVTDEEIEIIMSISDAKKEFYDDLKNTGVIIRTMDCCPCIYVEKINKYNDAKN